MFVLVSKLIFETGGGPVYWTGKTHTDEISEAKLYEDIADEPDEYVRTKSIPLEVKVIEYFESRKIFYRVEQLAGEIFRKRVVENIHFDSGHTYTDPSIEIGRVSLYWNDYTRILKEEFTRSGITIVSRPGYQIATVSYYPGVRYHSDGSGTPPDVDVVDVGKPHENLDMAIKEMFKLVLEEMFYNYLDYEADIQK